MLCRRGTKNRAAMQSSSDVGGGDETNIWAESEIGEVRAAEADANAQQSSFSRTFLLSWDILRDTRDDNQK